MLEAKPQSIRQRVKKNDIHAARTAVLVKHLPGRTRAEGNAKHATFPGPPGLRKQTHQRQTKAQDKHTNHNK